MKFSFVVLLLAAGLSGVAQKIAGFDGTYQINKSKINFGKAPENILPVSYAVKAEKKHIAITRKSTDPDREVVEDMKLDGTVLNRDLPTGKATALFTRIDDHSFMVDKTWLDKDGKVSVKDQETWNLEDNGKTLKVSHHVEQADGLKYELVGYYDKQ